MRRRRLQLALLASVSVSLAASLSGCDLLGLGGDDSGSSRPTKRERPEEPKKELAYVGREACKECHAEVEQSYAWSQHDRALELPGDEAVAAPFEGEKLAGKKLGGVFVKDGDDYVIQSGKNHKVKWTIGLFPLQQYLVKGQRGRVQAFPLAYDTREKSDGGKRWYILDGADVPASDPMHWQNPALSWNFMCAECHSTNVEKNYDLQSDSYDTKFAEIDVSCEACHGPGSAHIELAKKYKDADKWPAEIEHAGFEVALATYSLRRWVRGPDDKVARLEGNGDAPPERTEELKSCAPCHSHRSDLGPDPNGGLTSVYDERYRLSLLSPDLYYPDGQIKEEVYVYGSFLQSKMYAAGVVCSDCHNPHSTTLRKPVIDLCVSCHSPDAYDTDSHHQHPIEAEVRCVDCHMPERTYMGVDGRRDHQFSIPRPDLTLTLGVPNACESCHAHRPKWAAAMIADAHGEERPNSFASIFHAADQRNVEAPSQLHLLLKDDKLPAIVRASALERWAALGRISPEFVEAVTTSAQSKDVLLRRAAADASVRLPPKEQAAVLGPLYEDKVRSVRVAAALASLGGPAPEKLTESMKKALADAKAARTYDSDRPEGLLALAAIEERLKNTKEVDKLYKLAAERYPQSPVVFVNWADALRELKEEEQSQKVLVRGLKLHPEEPALLHSRGLWLVRQEKVPEAIPLLQQAFEKAPATLRRRYGYVYAVAVHDTGDWAEALAILRLLKNEYPEATEVQEAIVLYEEKRAQR